MPRAVAYVRVSTREQNLENQVRELEQLAEARGFELELRREVASTRAKERPVLEQLLKDAHRGQVRTLLVWALDRLDRSWIGLAQKMSALDACNVRVISVREPWVDTGGPHRSLLIGIFGWVGEQERERIRERTLAGLEVARAKGRKLGRPHAPRSLLEAAALQVERGLSLSKAARAVGVGRSTLSDYIAAKRGRPRHRWPVRQTPAH